MGSSTRLRVLDHVVIFPPLAVAWL